MAEDKKSEMKKLAEKLFTKKESASKHIDVKKATEFSQGYKEFISEYKTEREIIEAIEADAKKKGFSNLSQTTSVEKGGLYYFKPNTKNIALIRFGGLEYLHAVASHVDSPCLHLKPYPITESAQLGLFKTHYYGGIKKYQWLNIPLALKGVAFTQEGKKVDISIGEHKDDPVFTIPDLLPHLARDQMTKEARKLVEGEQLNVVVSSNRIEDEAVSDKIKLALMKHLNDEYGLIEDDLITAELRFVPAGPARDAGFDKSLVLGYGQDDSSSAYTSLQAFFDAKDADFTQIVAFYDKEEIGSFGKTGAQNTIFSSLIETLIDLSESDLRPSQVWERSRIISADVTAAIDPNFSDTHDSSNATQVGFGVAVEKYGGGGGKYSTNDAEPEFMAALLRNFKKQKVPWQTGELGKIDLGGGGTIAMYLAKHGADVIDIGIPVLAMHAPYELAHKNDIYSAYLCYKVFLEHPLDL